MSVIREAAVAGMFYPDDADVLRNEVQDFLASAQIPKGAAPKAIIAPHAGYRYSGALAAKAYARLKPIAEKIKRVILMGPCHRVAVQGLALSGAAYFETPLGRIEIDKDAEALVADLEHVSTFPPTHEAEHSLEVHLPFLQEVLGDFKLVPIVVGETLPAVVADALQKLWGGPETLIVISTDLSHFLDYDDAKQIDARTAAAISSLDPSKIEREGACGRFPVGGLLHYAKARGMRVETIGLVNSGDTAGTKERVVGYGAWAFYEPKNQTIKTPLKVSLKPAQKPAAPQTSSATEFEQQTKQLLKDHGPHLLDVADQAIQFGLKSGNPIGINLRNEPETLQAPGASFVTLKTANNQLRGCIGAAVAHQPLVRDVAQNAHRASFKDPRFKPVTSEEYETLRLSISVLSPQSKMTFKDEADLLSQLRPGIDGLVIQDGEHRALFLPSVWEQLPEPQQFLAHLKRKAGMALDHWSGNFLANQFIAEEIHAKS